MNSLSRNATSLMANARNRKDSLTNEEEKVFVRESFVPPEISLIYFFLGNKKEEKPSQMNEEWD